MKSLRIRLLHLRGENGQVLILTAVGMIAIIGFIALAVDVGNMRLVRRQLQAAADSAAIAGALELRQCAQVAACSTMQSAVQSSLVESGFSASTLLMNCDTTPIVGLEVLLNNGPCTLGTNDPHAQQHRLRRSRSLRARPHLLRPGPWTHQRSPPRPRGGRTLRRRPMHLCP